MFCFNTSENIEAQRCRLIGGQNYCPVCSPDFVELVSSMSFPSHRDPRNGAFSVEKSVPK